MEILTLLKQKQQELDALKAEIQAEHNSSIKSIREWLETNGFASDDCEGEEFEYLKPQPGKTMDDDNRYYLYVGIPKTPDAQYFVQMYWFDGQEDVEQGDAFATKDFKEFQKYVNKIKWPKSYTYQFVFKAQSPSKDDFEVMFSNFLFENRNEDLREYISRVK